LLELEPPEPRLPPLPCALDAPPPLGCVLPAPESRELCAVAPTTPSSNAAQK
jgi:hypothetical protein